ncbi:RNA polymerase sigma-70 factor [Kriegella aquimaris]|uniref:RNA polymerase sigma-70 factor, ECF subfamily n=1 Tax=Kriegella aquimaris TaxID=192904 RepID=A0A1G9LMS6_9FLAO|nr:RNA polymerase sigma-70 factor [Kriegella aquimaris]SDL63299.1 RNA polymerase sigma-70 factor, ECF subfamily [Kriegella aquimaris]
MPLKGKLVTRGESESLLVIELSKGNEKAFRALFEMYRKDVYSYSLSLLKSSANAKEIVQDVFMKVWLHRENLNPELSFKSFLFTITRNLSFNFLQKAVNDRNLRLAIFQKTQKFHNPIDRQIQDAEYESMRKRAIEGLSPKQRIIFNMSREESKSYQEISSELGISVSTVKNQMSKSLALVRNFLQANADFTLALVALWQLSN